MNDEVKRKLSDEEYSMYQQSITMIGSMIAEIPLDLMLERMERALAVGWILDPALYRKNGKNLEKLQELAVAMLKVKRVVIDLREMVGGVGVLGNSDYPTET